MNNASRPGAHAKLDYLEALRFLLACLTMAWHYYYFGPLLGVIGAAPVNFPALRYCSFGVDIFFVISGFNIIASALTRSPGTFMTNRLVRLGPCLLVCATITFLAEFAAGYGPSTLSLLSSVLVLPLPLVSGVDWSYWSLGTLVTFYLIVFAVMRFADIGKHTATLALLLTLYSAATLVPGFPFKAYAGTPYPFEQYAPFFALGILLYLLILRKRRSPGIFVALALTFAIVAMRLWMESARISELLTHTSPGPLSGPFMALAALAIFVIFTRKAVHPRVKQVYALLGRTSYPLYLIHQNLGYMTIKFAEKRLHIGIDVRMYVMACMVVLSIAIAAFLEPRLSVHYRRFFEHVSNTLRPARSRASAAKTTLGDAE